MRVLTPSPSGLARAVADTLVITADPGARDACLTWWEYGSQWRAAVTRAVVTAADDEISSAGQRLLDAPADPRRHAQLISVLLGQEPQLVSALFELAWEAECNSRLGYHLGSRYAPGGPRVGAADLRNGAADLRAGPGSGCAGPGADAEILIIVPFRDRSGDHTRLRNLLACLLALNDQSYPRSGYRVTVVEADEVPRWRHVIEPLADHYLFAEDPGPFNKSRAINAGAAHSPGRPEVLCILDADVLADREFIARNADRFRAGGTGGHLTYRNMLCLDAAASSWAIGARLSRKVPQADPDHLRGFFLRRPPGCCVWTRTAPFFRIGGMDERYQGWGGEDYDFLHRLDYDAPLDSYDDWLLHLYHPSSVVLGPDGQPPNAHIPQLTWQPTEPIGRLDRLP